MGYAPRMNNRRNRPAKKYETPDPSVGRIVHAKRYQDGAAVELAPAIVRAVDGHAVDLVIFGASIAPHHAAGVLPDEDDAEAPREDGWAWTWPPRS